MQFDRRATIAMALAAIPSACNASPQTGDIAAAGPDSLAARAAKKGMVYGTAVQTGPLRADPRYAPAITSDCNIIVPDAGLMWNRIQPNSPKDFVYPEADILWRFAQSHGMRMRGHALVWHDSLPKWFLQTIDDMTPGQVGDLLQKYVHRIAADWAGRVVHWTVVNEPVDSTTVRPSVWSRKLGETYIDLAFQAARDGDKKALLFVNQDLVEMDHVAHAARRTGILKLMERLKARNAPVHALGVQGHLNSANRFSDRIYDGFLGDLEGMGLKTMVTEFDVWDRAFPSAIDVRDRNVAALAKLFLDVSLARKSCLGVLTWGQTDLYSWLQQTPSKWRNDGLPNRGNVLDSAYKRKLLWSAVADSFDGAPAR